MHIVKKKGKLPPFKADYKLFKIKYAIAEQCMKWFNTKYKFQIHVNIQEN